MALLDLIFGWGFDEVCCCCIADFDYDRLDEIEEEAKNPEYPVFVAFHKGSEILAHRICNEIDRVFGNGKDYAYIYTKPYANFSDRISNNISGRIYECQIFIPIITMNMSNDDNWFSYELREFFRNSKNKKVIPVFEDMDCGVIPSVIGEKREYLEKIKNRNGVSTKNENYLYDLMDIIESYGVKRLTQSVTFRLPYEYAEFADTVYLAGSFNDWGRQGILMTRTYSGFETTITLEKGRKYYFKYVLNGTKWITPPHYQTGWDGCDGRNAIIEL